MYGISEAEHPYVKSVMNGGEIVVIAYSGSLKRSYVALDDVRAAAARKDVNCAFYRRALEQAEQMIGKRPR